MDALKLRSTGFKYVNNKSRPQTQQVARDRRRSKLRDLIVVRLIKAMSSQCHLKRRRLNELSKGSLSSRELNREKADHADIWNQHQVSPELIDKEFEEIAKIEVEAFLNQGKILTDKNLKHVEKIVRDKWWKRKGKGKQNDNWCYQSRSDQHLPNSLNNGNIKLKRGVTSCTPKVIDVVGQSNLVDNVYQMKGREGNRWGNVLSKKKHNIVDAIGSKLNNSWNPTGNAYKKSQNRYNYVQDVDNTLNYNRINASSCDKINNNRLDVSLKNNGASRNNHVSSSIIVNKKGSSKMATPTRTCYNQGPWIPKNKSNISLQAEALDQPFKNDLPKKYILNKESRNRWLYQKGLNRTLEEEQPYFK